MLELNEARINWFNASSNYNSVVTEAANDAGLDENSFPTKCPYDWDEIIAREFAV